MNVSQAVIINEVLYNPNDLQGGDTNGEWIELYNQNNETINLTGWILKDKGSSNTTLNIAIKPFSFLIIADNVPNFLEKWNCSCQIQKGNLGLSNSGDEIWLWNLISLEDYLNYSDIAEERESIQLINNFFIAKEPTPCLSNYQEQNQSNETYKPLISVDFPAEVYNNKTNFTINLNLINFTYGFYDLKIDIKNNTKYLNRFWTIDGWSDKNSWIENFTYTNNSNLSIEIISIIDSDDFFIGNATVQIKIRNSTTTFESNLSNVTILNGTIGENNNSHETNNQTNEENDPDSSIRIKDSPDKAKFGSTIEIEAKIYKGDTGKYAIYSYVQDENEKLVSDKIAYHVRTKFKEYVPTFEITLDCLNKSGNYEIIVEGLGEKDSEKIYLMSCYETSNIISSSITSPASNQAQAEENPEAYIQKSLMPSRTYSSDQITGYALGTFETSSFSFMKILFYVLSGLILILVLIAIIKRAR